jgi:predicted enzyme related to lactoylglutathione lyase
MVYQKVFGWEINTWHGPEDYWLIMTGERGEPGIDGALVIRMPGATTVNTVDVPSVDEFVQKVIAASAIERSGSAPTRPVTSRHRVRRMRPTAALPVADRSYDLRC